MLTHMATFKWPPMLACETAVHYLNEERMKLLNYKKCEYLNCYRMHWIQHKYCELHLNNNLNPRGLEYTCHKCGTIDYINDALWQNPNFKKFIGNYDVYKIDRFFWRSFKFIYKLY